MFSHNLLQEHFASLQKVENTTVEVTRSFQTSYYYRRWNSGITSRSRSAEPL